MNIFTGAESQELFGGEVQAPVRKLIEQVKQAQSGDEAASLLWTAQVSAPDSLPVYYLLYKLHATRGEFELAENAALRGLSASAEAAGLPSDWAQVNPDMADFSQPGAARYWLFTLKALAFIRVRRQQMQSATQLLNQVRRLDPRDGMGGDVIEALLRSQSGE